MRWLLFFFAAMSLVSLFAYRLDKSRAQRGERRTPERTLLALDFACGWPGGFVAQRLFRHKNRKTSYQIRFWLAAAANVATIGYARTHSLLPS